MRRKFHQQTVGLQRPLQHTVDDVAWRVLTRRQPSLAELIVRQLDRGEPAPLVAATARSACRAPAIRAFVECAVFGCAARREAEDAPQEERRRRPDRRAPIAFLVGLGRFSSG